MKVLVIGGGGREHALVWSLSKSPQVAELVCAPGNAGIALIARCEPVAVTDLAATVALALTERPDLVVIGPEIPLALGLADALHTRGIPVFGPTAAAARLESSKSSAKDFMRRHAIPTAAYATCSTLAEVEAALPRFAPQVVVKADGLAAGKGVILCGTHAEAREAAAQLFDGHLTGEPIDHLVLEETLTGPEISFFALCDGKTARTLAVAQDHKRIGESDTGPNTGGMGAYSTDTLISPELAAWLLQHVAQRTVDGMAQEGSPFAGILFCGIMLTPAGPRVLEFNTRFGDPETQAIVLRLDTDLLDLLRAAIHGTAADLDIRLKPGAAVCVIAASQGYPGPYPSGRPITGLPETATEPGTKAIVFHSGTRQENEQLLTAGGRVLGVSAYAPTLTQALAQAYETMDRIHFEGMHFRRDIASRALP